MESSEKPGEDEVIGNEEMGEVEKERMRLELREWNRINSSHCDLQAKALKEELTQPLQLLPAPGATVGPEGQQ